MRHISIAQATGFAVLSYGSPSTLIHVIFWPCHLWLASYSDNFLPDKAALETLEPCGCFWKKEDALKIACVLSVGGAGAKSRSWGHGWLSLKISFGSVWEVHPWRRSREFTTMNLTLFCTPEPAPKPNLGLSPNCRAHPAFSPRSTVCLQAPQVALGTPHSFAWWQHHPEMNF